MPKTIDIPSFLHDGIFFTFMPLWCYPYVKDKHCGGFIYEEK